jgi:uncharacterized protein YneF (UPF0154 family)
MTTFLVVMSILIVLLIILLFVSGYYVFTKVLKEFLDINTTLAACNKSIMNGYTDVKNQIGDLIKAMNIHSEASLNRYNDVVKELNNISSTLKAPIDKINDTHNRIKTLGKGCVASDELREIVAQVTNAAVTHGVDQVRTILEDQAKTKTASKTKKTAKTPVTEVKA